MHIFWRLKFFIDEHVTNYNYTHFHFSAWLLHDKPPGWLSQYPQQTCSNWPAKNQDCTHGLLHARHTSTHPSDKENHCQPTSTSQSKHQGGKQDVPWRSRQFCCVTTHQQGSQRHEKSLHRSASGTNEKSKSREFP